MTYAELPYKHLQTNHQVIEYVVSGKILDKPQNCTEELYQVMKKCWKQNPEKRPSFVDLLKMLQEQSETKDISENEYAATLDYGHTPEDDNDDDSDK